MMNLNTGGSEKVWVNFADPNLPENARLLQPLVWHEGAAYFVLLGADPKEGIFGRGETIPAALGDWNTHFKDHIARLKTNEEKAQFIRDALNASLYIN